MAVYVDQLVQYDIKEVAPAARRFGTTWCHMTADSDGELHALATKIGVPHSAFQWQSPKTGQAFIPPLRHYDLTPARREAAVKAGAIDVDAGPHLAARVAAWQAEREALAAKAAAEAEGRALAAEYNDLVARLGPIGFAWHGALTLPVEALRDLTAQLRQRVAAREGGDDGPADA